jgi:hypothetical protein
MSLLVRYGPAPGDTEDSEGNLHADFTGFFLMEIPETVDPDIAFARPAEGVPDMFLIIVKQIWDRVTGGDEDIKDCGHILIGRCEGFETVAEGSSACGFTLGSTQAGLQFAPKNYRPLFAVARAKRPDDAPKDVPAVVDMAVDYRGTTGPGDPGIRAGVFNPPEKK